MLFIRNPPLRWHLTGKTPEGWVFPKGFSFPDFEVPQGIVLFSFEGTMINLRSRGSSGENSLLNEAYGVLYGRNVEYMYSMKRS